MASTSGSTNMSQIGDTSAQSLAIEHTSSNPSQTNEVATSTSPLKRKQMKERSKVWEHFTKLEGNENEQSQCKCNYCGLVYKCDTKCGTSTLTQHLSMRCKKYSLSKLNCHDDGQAQLILHSSTSNERGEGEKIAHIMHWKFDQDLVRKAVARMFIVDELPFRHVESRGFQYFCNIVQPKFHVPSRYTLARDCYALFVEERLKLKSFLTSNCRRVCLTTDTWTSLQRINYMSLTAHFIDIDWKLQRKILNFCPISSHKGETIGKAIEKCLNGWDIEKVMTITVDNASCNDVAIGYLKRRINNWEGSVLKGEFLHMKCIAHIMNLVVNDGLKLANVSIARVRNVVRYVRQSPSRLQTFKACIEEEKIQNKSSLCLDVPTRWNSTYLMLDTAQKFQRAFERYEKHDHFFESALFEQDGLGKPTDEDWDKVRDLTKLLESFYDLTLRVSRSSYVTSNTYFHEISHIDCLLKEWVGNDNLQFSDMALKMKQKCDKYWGNPDKLNVMIFIAVVLDPRYKYEYIDFGISQMYDGDTALTLSKKVKTSLYSLFDQYKGFNFISLNQSKQKDKAQDGSASVQDVEQPLQMMRSIMKSRFKQYKAEKDSGDSKSELDKYLDEDIEEDVESFDILYWWKINSARFPILSQVARDVLAIPISTVVSESAFSTEGRVLDSFRSSLSPRIVEALICTQDWFRVSSEPLIVEEKLDDIERLDRDLSSINLAPNVIDVL